MNLFMKSLAVLSAVALLTACETAPNSKAGANGEGGMGGISGPVVKGSEQDLVQNVGDRVFFDTDSSALSSDAQHTLQKQAEWLKQYPAVHVTIEGHCDQRGTREYNLALGERRANAAKKYLASLGIASSRMSTISYGKERPAVIGDNEAAWSQNRRAVTVLNAQ